MKNVMLGRPKTVAVVVCTYNWHEALRLCLGSLTKQTRKPDEVIIADDGSTPETRKTIDEFRSRLPIKHIWQQDEGFRRAMALNKAFSACKSDYIIQVDGDIILGHHFVEDHINEARTGHFLVGSRGKLGRDMTLKMLSTGKGSPEFYSRGLTRRQNTIRMPFLTRFFYNYKQNRKERGCNMSFWRKDLLSVNGYDNGMVGYGSEDVDLAARLRRNGVYKRFIKFKAIEFHLYHKKVVCDRNAVSPNHRLYEFHNINNITRVEDGMAKFISHSQII